MYLYHNFDMSAWCFFFVFTQNISELGLYVVTGESTSMVYSLSMTVDQLKTQIQQKLKHQKGKQKLLYEGKEMSVSILICYKEESNVVLQNMVDCS
jgi:hypothetical protein